MEHDELIAVLREVRERVRARHPETAAGAGIALPDLMPLMHARDAASAKVASIGTVNPRPGGLGNALVQRWKRLVARVLDWHVREQVVFNRQAMACIDAALEALTETNRALAELGGRIEVAEELKDIRNHWSEWRVEWERNLRENETRFLRTIADLQTSFSHRADLMDANYRDTARAQHADFNAALERHIVAMDRAKLEYERLIHAELRMVRLRVGQASGPVQSRPIDYTALSERFRGPEDKVRRNHAAYVDYFRGLKPVLDIGCGRGEFLEAMRAAGEAAYGIDASPDCVAICREKGLDAETADLFQYLAAREEGSLGGIFCAHLVEHLQPAQLGAMIQLCASRLAPGGVIAIETPNPECLAIFATYFYMDPTHVRPVPQALLRFLLEENSLSVIETRKLAPAIEEMPSLAGLPEAFREAFFGALDYALVARKR